MKSSQVFPIFRRGTAVRPAKYFRKIAHVLKTALNPNIYNFLLCRIEKMRRLLQTKFLQKLYWRRTNRAPKTPKAFALTDCCTLCYLCRHNLFLIMFFYKLKHLFKYYYVYRLKANTTLSIKEQLQWINRGIMGIKEGYSYEEYNTNRLSDKEEAK